MHNFFCDDLGECGDELVLRPGESKHLFKILRAAKGERIGVLDGRGTYAEAEIIDNNRILIRSVNRRREPSLKIHLFIAPPTKSRMDQLLRQCAEAGVWAIHPIICRYSVAVPEKISERWHIILQEACKQSGNVFLPELHKPINLDSALREIKSAGMSLFYGAVVSGNGEQPLLSESNVAWLVGPEGGFSSEEIEKIEAAGAFALNLGPYIMRVETAAVCGVAVLNSLNKGME